MFAAHNTLAQQETDLEAGLSLTTTFSEGSVSSSSVTRSQNAVFACEVTMGTSPSFFQDAVLFEMGGSGAGHAVCYDTSGNFRVTAGDGAAPPNLATCALLTIPKASVPFSTTPTTIIWDIRINPGRVRLWIGDTFMGEANTSGGGALESNVWAGGANGGFGQPTGTPIAGAYATNNWDTYWSRDINSTLRYYQNQLVDYP